MPSKSLQTGNCLQTFTGHTDWVRSANFSPNGKKIVSASMDNSLKLWDFVCPVKVCRQLPAKSQSLRLPSPEAETICLPPISIGGVIEMDGGQNIGDEDIGDSICACGGASPTVGTAGTLLTPNL
jgi:WD40 repeat protein